MYRNLFKYAVMSLTILSANLLTGKIGSILTAYRFQYKPLTFTIISMAIIVLILYPLYSHLENWLTRLSAKIVKSGHSFGGKYIGLIFMFLLCLGVLFCLYAQMWFQINVVHLIFSGEIGNYF
jgi:hypothetical protein